MLHDLISATYRRGYKIELAFDDGSVGVVDFSKNLQRGGVLERFGEMAFFRNFSVNEELGVLTWGDEVDMAPEILYAEATGGALPAWMEPGGEKTERRRGQEERR